MRTLNIRLENEEESWNRLQGLAKQIDAGHSVVPSEGISFHDMGTYFSTITPRRLDAALRLRGLGPSSIRTLAKEVSRDYKSIHQDVQKLIELGMIIKRDDGLIEAPYDRIVIDMRFNQPVAARSHQPALLDGRRNEARKKRVRLERA